MMLLAILDAIGLLGFFLAAVFALRIHPHYRHASHLWMHIAAACFMGIIWSAVALLGELTYAVSHTTDQSLLFLTVFMFTTVALTTYTGLAKPLEK